MTLVLKAIYLTLAVTPLFVAAGCQQSSGESAGEGGESEPAAKAVEQVPKTETVAPQVRQLGSSDLLMVEDFSAMSTQELFDSVRTLERHLSRGETEDAREEDYRKSRRKILEIADELLSRDLEERLHYGAVLVQFDALSELINVDTPGALASMKATASGYLADDDADIVRVAREHLLMLETLHLADGEQVDVERLLELLGNYLAAAQEDNRRLKQADLMLVRQVASGLENAGRYEAARQVYQLAGTAFNQAATEAVRQTAEEISANGLKRIGLVGEPLELSGTLIDRGEFDWRRYEGKVVLVDFWASWCSPCVREFPALKQKYAKRREQGFEIVSICLDEQPAPAERAISLFQLPWPVLYSQDEDERGWQDPRAIQCGVNSLPAMFLLDRQGRVVSLSARGERLDALLDEMLASED